MRFAEKEYLSIDALLTPSSHSSSYMKGSQQANLTASLLPVYKIIKGDVDLHFILKAGYQDKDNKFYPCPILLGNIEISSVELTAEKRDRCYVFNTKSSIRIFSKDLKYHKIYALNASKLFNSLDNADLRYFESFISLVNNYIESDKSTDKLDLNKAFTIDQSFFYNKKIPVQEIMSHVNNLKIKLYECSSSRAGKDNYFWSRADIFNLPNDNYIRHLFAKALKDEYNNINEKTDAYSVSYDFNSSYSPYIPESEYDNTSEKEHIKDILKVFSCINYRKEEHLSYMITAE
jgi:hypothetical protein